MPTTEPIFQTVSSCFLEATKHYKEKRTFMWDLCICLGLYGQIHRDDVDGMKEAVNGFILNQVQDWIKETDPVTIECILSNNFKRLCEAGKFIEEREGAKQIHWQKVIENHVKLIASYSHILNITRWASPALVTVNDFGDLLIAISRKADEKK